MNELLNQMMEAIKQGGVIASETAMQYISYTIYSCSMTIAFAVITLGICVWNFKRILKVKASRKPDNWGNKDFIETEIAQLALMGVLGLILPLVIIVSSDTLLQALIAPNALILDKLSRLMSTSK